MGTFSYFNNTVENKFDQVRQYNGGLAAVRRGDLYGYINREKEVVIPILFEEVSPYFRKGLAYVKLNGKYGVINNKGEAVIPIKYDQINGVECDPILVLENDKWGMYDRKCNVIIPPKYDCIEEWVHIPRRRLFRVSLDDKFGIINKKGKEITPIQYDLICNFYEDMALVVKGSLYGFINTAGKEVIPPKYNKYAADNIFDICFKNGYAKLQLLKTLYIYIDKEGNEYTREPKQ